MVRAGRRSILAVAAVAAGLAVTSPVLAWQGLGPKWPVPTATYDTHTMPSNWVAVADFGAVQWDNVTPSPWDWVPNNSSNNDVYTGAIDGKYKTLAVTTVYYQGSTITRMTIKFDKAEPWYLGSGQPGSTQVDGRSVSAHEFGHGLGLGHTQSGYCPNDSNRATMCASYILGTSYQRSLEADDQNGLNSLYPQ